MEFYISVPGFKQIKPFPLSHCSVHGMPKSFVWLSNAVNRIHCVKEELFNVNIINNTCNHLLNN